MKYVKRVNPRAGMKDNFPRGVTGAADDGEEGEKGPANYCVELDVGEAFSEEVKHMDEKP